jgi:hypothetical protein
VSRWKRENPDLLIMMHAHNHWSQLYTYVLQAAEDLGIPVCAREHANHHDGSRDREWLVPHGTKARIYILACDRQRADWAKPDHSWGLADLPEVRS